MVIVGEGGQPPVAAGRGGGRASGGSFHIEGRGGDVENVGIII